MIKADIIADSVNPTGCRLTTFVVTANRFILAELNTHRMLSRNCSSSRAIPLSRMIKLVITNPAGPVYWGKNKAGMSASEELTGTKRWLAQQTWYLSRYLMCGVAWLMFKIGCHKQIANRLLEAWAHMTVIVSATDWGNFFNLRAHKDAQPEFQELAFKMLDAYERSVPRLLQPGEWHIPFGDRMSGISDEDKIKVATARCARVSYLNFEGTIDYNKDIKLHDRLLSSGHMSPFEMCAMAMEDDCYVGNFRGFIQYRKTIPNENRSEFDAEALLNEWHKRENHHA